MRLARASKSMGGSLIARHLACRQVGLWLAISLHWFGLEVDEGFLDSYLINVTNRRRAMRVRVLLATLFLVALGWAVEAHAGAITWLAKNIVPATKTAVSDTASGVAAAAPPTGHALVTAGKATGDAVADGAIATKNAVAAAAPPTGHALATAGKATGSAVVTGAVATKNAVATAAPPTGHALVTAGRTTGDAVADGAVATGHGVKAAPGWIAQQTSNAANGAKHAPIWIAQKTSGAAKAIWNTIW